MASMQHLRITEQRGLERILQSSTLKSVTLEIPLLDSEETQFWQSELNNRLQTCRCNEGAAALLLTLAALLVLALVFWADVKAAPWFYVRIGFVGIVASIVAGKVFGKLRGHRRLINDIRRLQALLQRRIPTAA